MNFVFDLDGTICYDGRTIDTNLTTLMNEKINQSAEHQLVFASARPVRDILPVLPESLHQCFLIGGNGTMMYHQKEAKWLNPLDSADVSFIFDYIATNQLDYMIDEDWNYSFKGTTLEELRRKVDVLQTAVNLPIDQVTKPLKILVSNYQNEAKVIQDFTHLTVDCIPYPKENCLDLTRRGVNKASALGRILLKQDYIAFGNDRNDLEMLQGAKHSVCVGDSQVIQEVSHQKVAEDPQQIMAVIEEWL
ncbi:HAD-IIB family hydrolase [uncultured Vagococcus sp.]|uniref:HAD-IIB family hydrolase n=1 Tax=uncultured Vagococcus sp. TaxID=189676 RepID=UPI0028D3F623|nr:HAD-IIB family hydrolase [uncultured Vagococcus sp.]